MPTFRHESIDRGGAVSAGVISAPDRSAAMRMLQAQGMAPVSIVAAEPEPKSARRPASGGGRASAPSNAIDLGAALRGLSGARSGRPTLKRGELANIIRELATAIEAGLPLLNALKTTRRQASGKAQPVILDFVIERVEAGRPLHEALEEYGAPFDDMIVGMVRAADASGRMSEVMHQLADLLDRSVELRRELIGATIYPLIVAFWRRSSGSQASRSPSPPRCCWPSPTW
jgi:type II secretory pathway component PulF